MKEGMKQTIENIASDQAKMQHVANTTTGIGFIGVLNAVIELIPQVITTSAAFAGLILTLVLIKKARAETRKIEIEERILAEQEKEREDRRKNNLPLRRKNDVNSGD